MSIITLVAALSLGSFAITNAPALDDDAKNIIGVWIPVEVEAGATVFPKDQVDGIKEKLTFKIEKDKLTMPDGDDDTEVGYTLTPKSTPKGLDTVNLNGPAKGEVRLCIYELDGDTLRICIASKDRPRPKKFSTKPGEEGAGESLIKFQRKK